MIGAAEAARESAAAARQPDEEAWVADVKARLRDELGVESFAAALQVGRELALRDAVARVAA